MPNNHHEALFSLWLEGRLTEDQREEFEALYVKNEEFSDSIQTANNLSAAASTFPKLAVPNWNKETTYSEPEKSRWWQWQGLPAVSMAFSFVAMLMVISGFNISVNNSNVTIGFGSSVQEDAVNQLVAAHLAEYQQSNQQMFNQYIAALQTQQQQNSSQLAEYLLSSSRQERREDFAELIKFINEQRDDDQKFYARQLDSLQNEISAIDDAYLAGASYSTTQYALPQQ